MQPRLASCPFVGRLFAVLALVLCALLQAVPARAQSASGQWQPGPNLPFFPVHAHVLPSGNVMIWPGDGPSGDDPRVVNPVTGTVTALSRAGFDLFCAGHNYLPDGRLFVAGGHIQNDIGVPEASIFNPTNNSWVRQPRMNLGRWYPTNTLLPNGDMLVVSGSVDLSTGSNPLPQVWQAASGTWRSLTSAQLQLQLYPYMFVAPNGRVFNAGPGVTTRLLDTAGTGAWSFVGNRVHNAMRDYGGAVMYEPGKILAVGGGDPPTATAEVIDLNAPAPAWRAVGSMTHARRQMGATMLPDGKVLVTGGSRGTGWSNADTPVLAAELWDPATERWTVLASAGIPRLYHSIALLLPDARVMVTGGNGYTQSEMFSPPYLFAGPRPVIESAPASVGQGQSFFVGTPNAAGIQAVAWIRLPSVTHTNNMSQAYFRSTSITQVAGGIQIVAPSRADVPLGHYMLFVLQNGVPSVARIVQLGVPNNPAPVLAGISPSSATAGSPGFALTVNGSGFVASSRVRWNGADRTTRFVSSTQLSADIPAGDVAAAGTAQVTVFNPTPGGGTSAAQTFTTTASQNLTRAGGIIARVTAPLGQGSRNLEIIRDGVRPAPGTSNTLAQYDTWDGANTAAEDWIGYQYGSPQTFNRIVFQEGMHFGDGGWFTRLQVQVRRGGVWSNVAGLTVLPAYSGINDGRSFDTYTLRFAPVEGDAIRIQGDPGGSADFISVAELEVHGLADRDVTRAGSIIARVTAAQGQGARNLEIIRDGVRPAVGTSNTLQQYDTWDGANTAAEDWIGYQFASPQTFTRVVFQEGMHFADGGWFTTLHVQVRQNGVWNYVPNLIVSPAYAGNNGRSFETYTLRFTPTTGDAIRIQGDPGGSADFISVGELEVFAR